MILNILYILLAALGLSFIVFIHELGHYFMARRVGIRVLVFSIGFGKPIFKWKRGEVEWRVCYLLFGGYVKMAGMESEEGVDPLEVKDGFFGKRPIDRILVALAGPLVNIVFALIVFTGIWAFGGRDKPFSEFTNVIGYVDKSSELYKEDVKPGDQIVSLNNKKYQGFKDLLFTAVTEKKKVLVDLYKINYYDQKKTNFYTTVKPYEYPGALSKDFKTIGILRPASFLIYKKHHATAPKYVVPSPMEKSSIEEGDRIVWVDGEFVFSHDQLSDIINSNSTLLSVKRNGNTFITKVPKILVRDLKLKDYELDDLKDWQHDANLKGDVASLAYVPYALSGNAVVKKHLYFIGDDLLKHNVYDQANKSLYFPLKEGDQILAVDGQNVFSSFDVLKKLQSKKVQIIVQRKGFDKPMLWTEENKNFFYLINPKQIRSMVASIAKGEPKEHLGDLVRLSPVSPISLESLVGNDLYQAQQQTVEKIKDPVKREMAQKQLASISSKKVLGIPLVDKEVIYNPGPWTIFADVVKDTWRTLSSLLTGKLKPKWLSGPIGMAQALHQGWSLGIKEASYWIATISLGLGLFNLLPLPVLDGGYIGLSIYEQISRKRLSAKAMEKLIIPFMVLLVALMVYVTYQDIIRIAQRFF